MNDDKAATITTEELADFIFRHRLACLASGEGGLVDPVPMGALEKLFLEEWALDAARRHKSREAYLLVQADARDRLQALVAKVYEEHAREVVLQGLEVQAAMTPKVKPLWN
jgi:hypothetical protein